MVGRAHLDAVDDVVDLAEVPRRLERRVRERLVVLVEARIEDPDDGEALEPRPGAERRRRAAEGRDQEQRVADLETQRAREIAADHDAGGARVGALLREAGDEIRRRLALDRAQIALEIGDAPTLAGSTPRSRTLAISPWLPRTMPSASTYGTRRLDAGDGDDRLEHLLPVREGAEAAVDREVRAIAEDLLAPGLLEAVHHRQHDDDEPYARGDAGDADGR